MLALWLEYEKCLFPLRDSQVKRTCEQKQKSPGVWKHYALAEPLVYWLTTLAARHMYHISTWQASFRTCLHVRVFGDQTNTYYVTVSIYRKDKICQLRNMCYLTTYLI